MKSVSFLALLLMLPAPSLAQKLIDPSKVAPEYREAAEKRLDEQLRQIACTHKADADKVPRRDRAAFVLKCMDDVERATLRKTR